MFAGSTRGLKLRLRGQMGVSSRDGTSGWMMLPPLLRLYAVLPVGVETIMPSATASVRNRPPTKTSTIARCGSLPRWMMTSFIACTSPFAEAMLLSPLIRSPEAAKTPTFSRFRSRTLAPLVEPNDFPRTDDQPVSPVSCTSACSSKGDAVLGFSPRTVPLSPTPAPDM